MKISSILSISAVNAAASPKVIAMLNDYAGVQNNLKGHSNPTYGDESILKQIADYNEITGRTLLSEKTTPAQMKEKLAEGVMLNLNTMLAAVMPRDERSMIEDAVNDRTKWLNYGCYCSPHQRHYADTWIGHGKPVDQIDALCQQLWNCYRCLEKTIDNCVSTKSYKWDLKKGASSYGAGKPTCANPEGSCRGELCRCESQFVNQIAKIQKTWTKKYHIDHGFNRKEQCQRRGTPNPGEKKCCGQRLGFQLYNPDRKECCADGKTATIGTCDGSGAY